MLIKNLYCLFLLVFILFSHQAVGQFAKGDLLLGGGFGFSTLRHSSSYNDPILTQFNIHLEPQIERFISARSSIGVVPHINLYWGNGFSTNYSGIGGGMGLFFRRYFSITDKFLVFVQPTATYLKDTEIGYESGHHRFLLSVIPGAAYRFNNRWMVELRLGGITQEWRKNDIGTENEQSIRQFDFGIQTNSTLGLFYIISKKP